MADRVVYEKGYTNDVSIYIAVLTIIDQLFRFGRICIHVLLLWTDLEFQMLAGKDRRPMTSLVLFFFLQIAAPLAACVVSHACAIMSVLDETCMSGVEP